MIHIEVWITGIVNGENGCLELNIMEEEGQTITSQKKKRNDQHFKRINAEKKVVHVKVENYIWQFTHASSNHLQHAKTRRCLLRRDTNRFSFFNFFCLASWQRGWSENQIVDHIKSILFLKCIVYCDVKIPKDSLKHISCFTFYQYVGNWKNTWESCHKKMNKVQRLQYSTKKLKFRCKIILKSVSVNKNLLSYDN